MNNQFNMFGNVLKKKSFFNNFFGEFMIFYCFDDDFIIILNLYKDRELSKQTIIIKSYLRK